MFLRILFGFLLVGTGFFFKLSAQGICDSTRVVADSITQSQDFSIRKDLNKQDYARFITTFGLRAVLRVATVNVLKNNVHEWRPNRENRQSFPSRHAVWAYGIGGKIAYMLGPYNPWWAVGAQTAANIVGFQRVISKKHYPSDVLAGAGLGIGTDLLAYEMGNWIFGRKPLFPNWNKWENENRPCLSMSTGASFPVQERWGEYKVGTSLYSDLRYSMPTSDKWTVIANLSLNSAPVKKDSQVVTVLNTINFGVGPQCHYNLSGPLAIGGVTEFGVSRYLAEKSTYDFNLVDTKWALSGRVGAMCSVTMTKRLALGLEAGYKLSALEIASMRRAYSSFYVAFSTQVRFL